MCTVEIRAIDAAGNISAVASRSFGIDLAAPTTSFNSPSAGSRQNGAFTISVSDSDSGGLGSCYFTVRDNGTVRASSVRTCNSTLPISASRCTTQ